MEDKNFSTMPFDDLKALAKKHNDKDAWYEMAKRYKTGNNCPHKNISLAKSYIIKASMAGNVDAINDYINTYYTDGDETFIEIYEYCTEELGLNFDSVIKDTYDKAVDVVKKETREKAKEDIEKQSGFPSYSTIDLEKKAKTSRDPVCYYELAMRYGKGINGTQKNVLDGLYFMKLSSDCGYEPALQQYVPLAIKYDACNDDIVSAYEKGVAYGIQYGKEIDEKVKKRKQHRYDIPKSWEMEMPKDPKDGQENYVPKKFKTIKMYGLKFPKGSYTYEMKTISSPQTLTDLDCTPTTKEYKIFVPAQFVYNLCQEIMNGNPEYSEWSLLIDSRHHLVEGCIIKNNVSYGDMGAGQKNAYNSLALYINKPGKVHTEVYGIDDCDSDGCVKVILLFIAAVVAVGAIILGVLWYFDLFDIVGTVFSFTIIAIGAILWFKEKMMDE